MSDKQEENTFLKQELENEGLDLSHDPIKTKNKLHLEDYDLRYRDE